MEKSIIFALVCLLLVSGCALEMPQSNSGKGALLGTGAGAAVGAGLGQLIGGDTESTLIGAGVGAAVGAGAGYAWGQYLDKQEAALREQLAQAEAVQIKREKEQLSLTFKSDMMFDSGSYAVKPGAYNEIVRVSRVLNQYPETIIIVRGHTDSQGSEAFNQSLSENRSVAVKNILVGQSVNPERVLTMAYGETEPIADNRTEAGRQANRRVEISIANPEMFTM